jgi:hypothetical protein
MKKQVEASSYTTPRGTTNSETVSVSGRCEKATTRMGKMIDEIWVGKTSDPLRTS